MCGRGVFAGLLCCWLDGLYRALNTFAKLKHYSNQKSKRCDDLCVCFSTSVFHIARSFYLRPFELISFCFLLANTSELIVRIDWSNDRFPVPMLIIIYFDKYSIWFLFLINHIYCMWISIALHSSILVFLFEYSERLQTFAHEWWTIKYFGHATTTANSSILLHRSNGAASLFRSFPTVSFSNQIN